MEIPADHEMHGRYDPVLKQRAPGTNRWLLERAEFARWRDATFSTPLLWIHGSPGSGKTVLSGTVIDHLRDRPGDTAPASVAYHSFHEVLDQSSSYALEHIAAQIEKKPVPIMRRSGTSQGYESGTDLLGELSNIISGDELKRTYVVIDALDECGVYERQNFLKILGQLMDTNKAREKLRIFVTSRLNPDILDKMRSLNATEIQITEQDLRADIVALIDETISSNDKLRRLKPGVKDKIRDCLLERANGSPLHVQLSLQELSGTPMLTAQKVHEFLENSRQSLGSLYESRLLAIGADVQPFAIAAIKWLVTSFECISVSAMAEAVTFEPGSTDDNKLVNEEDVLGLLKDLVVVQDDEVKFMHISVVEFLKSIPNDPARAISAFQVNERDAHFLLATTCLEYIKCYAYSEKRTRNNQDLVTYPLLWYSCRFWMDHTRRWSDFCAEREVADSDKLTTLVTSILSDPIVLEAWTSVFRPEYPELSPFDMKHEGAASISTMYYAAMSGVGAVVTRLIANGAVVSGPAIDMTSALLAAVRNQAEGIVRFFLKEKASTVVADSNGQMPLLEAALSGQEGVTLLLRQHTKPEEIVRNLPHLGNASILHRLAAESTGPIFTLVLDPRTSSTIEDVDVHPIVELNVKDQSGRTPLHHAVKYGNIPVAHILLDKGANINLQDGEGNTPLHLAASSIETSAWDLLVDYGASFVIENNKKLTPLAETWHKKSLNWEDYSLNQSLSLDLKGNTTCRVLTKISDSQGPGTPQHIFEKSYDLSKLEIPDLNIYRKALGRENAIFQRLNHPYIVSYLGFKDIETDRPKLYLEYCDGGDLERDIVCSPPSKVADDESGQLTFAEIQNLMRPDGFPSTPSPKTRKKRIWSEEQVWKLVYQLFAALAHLHYGVSVGHDGKVCVYESHWDPAIHRDINPKNVVLVRTFSGEFDAKICDLGIARDNRVNMTLACTRGTRNYQPPELSNDQWSTKGDVWALGKTISELRKDFTPDGSMKKLLKECQSSEPNQRPNSLHVLKIAHQHVSAKFLSLENELEKAQPRSLIYYAFVNIAEQMDTQVRFMTDAAIDRRTRHLDRLRVLLNDGAMREFETSCLDLRLAVLCVSINMKSRQPLEKTRLWSLLQQDVNPDDPWPKSGWTALHLAAQQGERDVVEKLLEKKANPLLCDIHGWTALEYSVHFKRLWGDHEVLAIQALQRLSSQPEEEVSDLQDVFTNLGNQCRAKQEALQAIGDMLRKSQEASANASKSRSTTKSRRSTAKSRSSTTKSRSSTAMETRRPA